MWAVVEVSDGYPNWGCEVEQVWMFATVEEAQAWACQPVEGTTSEMFVVKVSEMK